MSLVLSPALGRDWSTVLGACLMRMIVRSNRIMHRNQHARRKALKCLMAYALPNGQPRHRQRAMETREGEWEMRRIAKEDVKAHTAPPSAGASSAGHHADVKPSAAAPSSGSAILVKNRGTTRRIRAFSHPLLASARSSNASRMRNAQPRSGFSLSLSIPPE